MERVGSSAGSQAALDAARELRRCGDPSNVWVGLGLPDGSGATFEGVGTLYECRLPFCPSCSADKSRRSRHRLHEALARVTLRDRERWRHITLTGPPVRGEFLITVLSVVLRAFGLLRKRKLWARGVRAGVRCIEFTVDENRDYSAHIHTLVAGRYVPHGELRAAWSACLTRAWAERGEDIAFRTLRAEALIYIQLVLPEGSAAPGPAATSLEEAVRHVTNYFCKWDAWERVGDAGLVEFAEVTRWPRLFDALGEARRRSPTTSLVIKELNDGRKRGPKPGHCAGHASEPEESARRVREYRRRQLANRYPASTLFTLSGELLHDGAVARARSASAEK